MGLVVLNQLDLWFCSEASYSCIVWREILEGSDARLLFARLDIFPVFSVYLLESCKFVRKYPYCFVKSADVHSHATRGRTELFVFLHNMSISKQNPLHCLTVL